mgnify:CR=1 FL=1
MERLVDWALSYRFIVILAAVFVAGVGLCDREAVEAMIAHPRWSSADFSSLRMITTGSTIVPRHVLGGPGFIAPSDQFNYAVVGFGGMGSSNAEALSGGGANLVAVCDADPARLQEAGAELGAAFLCSDYREALERNDIDAVVIATPAPVDIPQAHIDFLISNPDAAADFDEKYEKADLKVFYELTQNSTAKVKVELFSPENKEISSFENESTYSAPRRAMCWTTCGCGSLTGSLPTRRR